MKVSAKGKKMNHLKDDGLLAEKFDDLLLRMASRADRNAFVPTARAKTYPGWDAEMRRALADLAVAGPDPDGKVARVMRRLEDLGRPVSLRRARSGREHGVMISLPGPRVA